MVLRTINRRYFLCFISVLYRSCKAYHNGRWGTRWSICRSWSVRRVQGFVFSMVYTLRHPGTKPLCLGHTRVCTLLPHLLCTLIPYLFVWVILGYFPGTNLFVLVILGYAPWYPTCFCGHTPVCTRVPTQFALVLLRYVPWYHTCLFWLYSGMYPGTNLFF